MTGQDSKFCKRCGAPASSNARFCGQCGYDHSDDASEIRNAGAACPYPPEADQGRVGSLDLPLRAAILFSVLLIPAHFIPSGHGLAQRPSGLGVLVLALLVASVIAHCILLYRWWACLPPGWRQTSPGKAVGYGFIPFYCFYWWFIAYVGLANDVNRFNDQHSPRPEPIPTWLPVSAVIAKILSAVLFWVPIPANIFAVASLVVGIAFALSATRACKSVLAATGAAE